MDSELNKEIEQWNEMLKNDAVKLCQESNFNTGFFEGSDTNSVVDAYELKVKKFRSNSASLAIPRKLFCYHIYVFFCVAFCYGYALQLLIPVMTFDLHKIVTG